MASVQDILLANSIAELRTADADKGAVIAYLSTGGGRLYHWDPLEAAGDNGDTIIRNPERNRLVGGGAWVAESRKAGTDELYLSDYTDLNTAGAALQDGDTLIMDVPSTLTTNLTVPAGVLFRFNPGNPISLSNYNLTINGYIDAGNYQIFDYTGTGSVSWDTKIEPSPVNVKWWGATGDGTTDDEDAINNALLAAAHVFVPSGVYRFTRIWLNGGNWLQGNGEGSTIFKMLAYAVKPDCMGIGHRASITTFEVSDFEVDGNAVEQTWFDPLTPQNNSGHGISMLRNCGGDAYPPPQFARIRNIYAHDCVRNPFLLAGDAIEVSNIRAKNSYGDHLIYAQHSENSNIQNVVCEGYWFGASIASEGHNFSNIVWRNLAENPHNPTLSLSSYINDRDSDSDRGSNYTNLTAEYDPSLSAASFIGSASTGLKITNVVLEAVSTDITRFVLLDPATGDGGPKGTYIKNVEIREAQATFELMLAVRDAQDIVLEGVKVYYAAGVTGVDELFDLQAGATIDRLTVRDLTVNNVQCGELLRVRTTCTINNVLFENVHLDTVGTYIVLVNSGGTINGLTMRDCVFEDSGGASLRGLLSAADTFNAITLDNIEVEDLAAQPTLKDFDGTNNDWMVVNNLRCNSPLEDFRIPGIRMTNMQIGEEFDVLLSNGCTIPFLYDFSVDGGAQGVIEVGFGDLPDNAVVTRAWYEVLTGFGSGGAATVAFGTAQAGASGELKTATAFGDASYGAGYHDFIPDGTSANFTTKTTDNRAIVMTIAGADLNAGKIRGWVEYIVSE